MMNLCIVNEDYPPCTLPRKTIKACPGRGQLSLSWALSSALALSHLDSGHATPFLHRISVVRVYLYIVATTLILRAGICVRNYLPLGGKNKYLLYTITQNFLNRLVIDWIVGCLFDTTTFIFALCPRRQNSTPT